VTRLRKMMLEELQRRYFSKHTIRYYIRTVEDFARHFNRPPDRLGLRHIREYQAELFQKRKLSPGTVANRLAALRFFYIKTLRKSWSVAETPYPKKNHRLPAILSQEEVARLIDAAGTLLSIAGHFSPAILRSSRWGMRNKNSRSRLRSGVKQKGAARYFLNRFSNAWRASFGREGGAAAAAGACCA
jgi:site-specific recombinase XerD